MFGTSVFKSIRLGLGVYHVRIRENGRGPRRVLSVGKKTGPGQIAKFSRCFLGETASKQKQKDKRGHFKLQTGAVTGGERLPPLTGEAGHKGKSHQLHEEHERQLHLGSMALNFSLCS